MAHFTRALARAAALPLAGLVMAGIGTGTAQAVPAGSAPRPVAATHVARPAPLGKPRPVGACTASRLSARFRQFNAGAGQRYLTLVLVNRSRRACYVSGYERLRFAGRHRRVLRVRVVRSRQAHGPVILSPGRKAHSCLSWEAIQGPFAHPVRVRITALPRYAHLARRWPGGPIGMHRVRITPLQPGSSCV